MLERLASDLDLLAQLVHEDSFRCLWAKPLRDTANLVRELKRVGYEQSYAKARESQTPP